MKYFTIKELCRSDVAKACRIDNTANDEVVKNLEQLVKNVLDPLREWYGKPIRVNSGYRCKELNAKVGGVPTSYHTRGYAADITVGEKMGNELLFNYIKENLPFKEMGWENKGQWIHVAYIDGENDKEVFYT